MLEKLAPPIRFLASLLLFFTLILLSPNKIIYFSAYPAAVLLFYLSVQDLRRSLLLAMILAVFSDVYLGAGLFRLEPAGFNMGSGWWISPVTILMPVMLLFSLKVKLKKNPADIFLLLFFVWSALTFTFNTDQNSFYGMIALSESVLLYFLFRLYLKKEDQPFLTALFLAILLFQTFIGLWQFYLGRPIGLIAESIIADNPAGITTSENIRLFRISGTFGHPNVLAAFLLVLYPFLDLFKSIKSWANTFRSMVILAFIFTFSRLAWVVLLIVHLIFSYSLPYSIAIDRFRKKFHLNRKAVIYLSTVLIIIYLLFPYILLRFKTIPASLDEFGSLGTRVKLDQEAIALIKKNPLVGTGLNKSLESYIRQPSTNIFENNPPGIFYKIHNTFLEITAETGIPGLLLFVLFLVSVIRSGSAIFSAKAALPTAAYYGLLSLIIISYVNPFFHTSVLKWLFLLSSILLI